MVASEVLHVQPGSPCMANKYCMCNRGSPNIPKSDRMLDKRGKIKSKFSCNTKSTRKDYLLVQSILMLDRGSS